MSVVLVGAGIALFVLVTALAGARFSQWLAITMSILVAAVLLAAGISFTS